MASLKQQLCARSAGRDGPLHDQKVTASLKPGRARAQPSRGATLHDQKVMASLKHDRRGNLDSSVQVLSITKGHGLIEACRCRRAVHARNGEMTKTRDGR